MLPLLLLLLPLLLPSLCCAGSGEIFPPPPPAEGWWRPLSDIATWRYQELESLLRGQTFEPRSRVWDRSDLRHSHAVVNPNQFRALIDKLQSGQRIVVTAIGSSMVGTYGGCWGGYDRVKKVVNTLHHTYSKGQGRCSAQLENTDAASGWLQGFMVMVNRLWPHEDHVLVNLGSGGHPFQAYADQGCLDSHIPEHSDLVILEQNEACGPTSTSLNAERFLWRLNQHFRPPPSPGGEPPPSPSAPAWTPPPVVLVSTLPVTEHRLPSLQCMADGMQCEEGGLCGGPGGWNHTLLERSMRERCEDLYCPLLQYMGYSGLSLRNLYNALLRDGALERRGLRPCRFFAAMVEDSMHPDPLGRVLLADMLVNLLFDTLEALEQQAKWAAPASSSLPSSTWRLPSRPLSPGGSDILLTRCYGSIEVQRDGEHAQGEASSFTSLAATNTLEQIKVVKNVGWQYVEHQVHGTVKKYKPGWVATTADSVLQIQLDTSFANSDPGVNATLVLMYLQSYEHMGQAELSCVEHCVCSSSVIDAHQAGQEVSVIQWRRVPVSQHPQCLVQLRVLGSSKSGEHKFKMVQAAITINVKALHA